MALTAEKVYTYVKDNATDNDLLEGVLQSSTDVVTLAMELAIDDFNAEQPVTKYSSADFPSDTVLLYGTLHHIANGEAERQLRNQITYSAQGLNANIDDKYEQYSRLSQYYRQIFESKSAKLKQSLNMAAAWGGMNSPYISINTLNTKG